MEVDVSDALPPLGLTQIQSCLQKQQRSRKGDADSATIAPAMESFVGPSAFSFERISQGVNPRFHCSTNSTQQDPKVNDALLVQDRPQN